MPLGACGETTLARSERLWVPTAIRASSAYIELQTSSFVFVRRITSSVNAVVP